MTPELKIFKNLSKKYSLVPVCLECSADCDTPVTVFLKVAAQKKYSALLESVEGGEKFGRYSFIALSDHFRFESYGNKIILTHSINGKKEIRNTQPLAELKKIFKALKAAPLPELPQFSGGAVGMISYDMVRNFEKLPNLLPNDLHLPDALLLFTDEGIVFDHWNHKMFLVKWNLIQNRSEFHLEQLYKKAQVSLKKIESKIRAAKILNSLKTVQNKKLEDLLKSNFSKKEYCNAVLKTKKYIEAGDVIQTVLSQRFMLESNADPFHVYRALRVINPSPYLYFFKFNDFALAGSSPEILVRKEGNTAITRPIAGTRKRGKNLNQDLALEKELISDPKERAEHLMLVDLGRNDLGRCCEAGTVKVKDFMNVERYSHVMHLVSTVEGSLKPKEDAFSLFKACFPAG
ncbi:MAG: chorismate-binding protein, partial [Elusimicrobia bacterium]|nr:chorismate-binding protein [Elusimicrobiota bacterium]